MTYLRMANPDAMSAAAHYLASEWGEYGYRIGLAGHVNGTFVDHDLNVYVWQCAASDGSRFLIWTDRYGNRGDIRGARAVELGELLGVESGEYIGREESGQ